MARPQTPQRTNGSWRHTQARRHPEGLPEPRIHPNGPPGTTGSIWNGSGNASWDSLPKAPTPPRSLLPPSPNRRPCATPSSQASAPAPEQRSHTHNLDRFAPIYIPLWMRQIATAEPAHIIRHSVPPGQDWHAFAAAIFPKSLYDEIKIEEDKTGIEKILTGMVGRADKLEKLDNTHVDPRYASKLLSLQIKEYQARKVDLADSTLYNVAISPVTSADGGISELFKLEAPMIKEGYPMLDVNDVVFLRHLRNTGNGATWDGTLYLAEVRNIKRAQAYVLIQCKSLTSIVKDGPEYFIVGFEPQGRPYYAAREATISVQHHLQQESRAGLEPRLAHSWLFPSLGDYMKPMPPHNDPPPLPSTMVWRDRQLNTEQRLAIMSLAYRRRAIPYLISGPPGTGKTKTIVEAVLQILAAYSSGCILLCGASNASTDTLATRLSAHLSPKQMFRLSDASRPFDEVSGRLLPYCHIVGSQFGIPDFATLRNYRVIVTSTLDTSVLTKFTFTNDNLARLEHSLLSQWQPEVYNPLHYHFDYFICDEAAQLTEQDILPALSVMMPSVSTRSHHDHQTRRLPQVCLVGDFQQLGPFVTSSEARAAELDVSLLQRLFERPLYRDHPGSRQNMGTRMLLTRLGNVTETSAADSKDLSAPLCNLVKNYRSHVGLLMVPSFSFYNDTLQPCAPEIIQKTPMLRWPLLTSRTIPLLIWHTDGTEDMVDEGSSWYNSGELAVVVDCVTDLLANSSKFAAEAPLEASHISIISPFREQVWKLRMKLRSLGLGDVNVGRESDMQGAENRVIIISPVRTSLRFVPDDRKRNRGLIFEPKRFNVATTRSKELLIIVGHVPTLRNDPFWRPLIQLGIRHGCCKGLNSPQLDQSDQTAPNIGALEELLLQQQHAENENIGGRIIAGSVAHAVLREEGAV